MNAPPVLLDSARVLLYAETGGSSSYTGRVTMYAGEKILEPVPYLAICEELVEGRILVLHCDDSWNVLAANFDDSVEAAVASAERAYAGTSSSWKQYRRLSEQEQREVEELQQSLQKLATEYPSESSPRLASPSRAFQSSYRSLLDELEARGEELIPFPLTFPHDDFDAMIARLAEHSQGRGIPDGFVANSTFWLVSDSEVVGVSNLRHSLTPALEKRGGNIGYGIRPSARRQGFGTELLRLTLGHAKEMGLAKLLITCGKENTGSVKVILANGGVLESEEFLVKHNEVVQRYWIDLRRPKS